MQEVASIQSGLWKVIEWDAHSGGLRAYNWNQEAGGREQCAVIMRHRDAADVRWLASETLGIPK